MNSYLAQAQNNHWSNRRLFSACFALSHDEYVAKRTSFFPSIETTLLHILEVDGFYLEGDRQRRYGRGVISLRIDDGSAASRPMTSPALGCTPGGVGQARYPAYMNNARVRRTA